MRLEEWDRLFPQQALGLLASPPLETSQNPFHRVATKDGVLTWRALDQKLSGKEGVVAEIPLRADGMAFKMRDFL